MVGVKCLNNNIYVDEVAFELKDFPFNELIARAKRGYIEKAFTFDIETTTYNENDEPKAFMYIWQACIEGRVIFGRTWQEFITLLDKLKEVYNLDEKTKLVCYVHNLSFEFMFMKDFIKFKSVFATQKRKLLKCSTDFIEFRCSYRLSNMSLEKFIENTPTATHNKGINDLDYKTIRTPSTKLTDIELGYCYNDVMGLYECIEFLLQTDTIKSIPLTSTGYVRRDCRNAMRKNRKNHYNFIKTKLDKETYLLLNECFRGGNTASNRYLTNEIQYNVTSYDISSSYPYVMLTKYYPVGKFMYTSIDNEEMLIKYNSKYCTIGRYLFKNLKLKRGVAIPYIPVAKCLKVSTDRVYNGRVLNAEVLAISLTNLDYDIIAQEYEWDEVLVKDFYFSRRGLLPQELRNVVMEYFKIKSTLRGVEGKEYEYNKAKNRLNSCYGMCVTSPVRNEITLDDEGEWQETPKDIDDELEKFYKSRNNFLSYQWGVFISAWGRVQLQKGLDIVGIDCVYCDTDSVKYINDYTREFNDYNKALIDENAKKGLIHSTEVNGKNYILGIFDLDGEYDEFKTLGAKKYGYISNGHLGVTISGLNKKLGAKELEDSGGLQSMKIGKVFVNSGRTIAYYNNESIHDIKINDEVITTASNVAIIETTYTLGISETMLEIIEELKSDII